MTYFFDNNISDKLVILLKALDVDARHLKEDFPVDTADVDWPPYVGQKGWTVVTADRAIRRPPAELAALKDAHVTALFMKDNFLHRNKWEQAAWLVRLWREIDRQATRLAQGTIVSVSDKGKLEVLR